MDECYFLTHEEASELYGNIATIRAALGLITHVTKEAPASHPWICGVHVISNMLEKFTDEMLTRYDPVTLGGICAAEYTGRDDAP